MHTDHAATILPHGNWGPTAANARASRNYDIVVADGASVKLPSTYPISWLWVVGDWGAELLIETITQIGHVYALALKKLCAKHGVAHGLGLWLFSLLILDDNRADERVPLVHAQHSSNKCAIKSNQQIRQQSDAGRKRLFCCCLEIRQTQDSGRTLNSVN